MMMNGITIENVRGIERGVIEGLTPVSVFVGRNGCGKSTVLDAFDIATAASPYAAITASLDRRTSEALGPEWLLRTQLPAQIEVRHGSNQQWAMNLSLQREALHALVRGDNATEATKVFGTTRSWAGADPKRRSPPFATNRFIDLRSAASVRLPLHELFSAEVKAGRKSRVLDILRLLVPEAEDLVVLTENNIPGLYVVKSKFAVPLSLSGDGIRNIVLLAIELGVPPESLVLIEEPETHLHPAAMGKAAEAIFHAANNSSQVLIATHSLEMIDALVQIALRLKQRDLLSVHRLANDGGQLKVSTFAGQLVEDARRHAELELR